MCSSGGVPPPEDANICAALARRFVADVRAGRPASLSEWVVQVVDRGRLKVPERVVVAREVDAGRVVIPLDGAPPRQPTARLIEEAQRRIAASLADLPSRERVIADALFARRVLRDVGRGPLEWRSALREGDTLSEWVLALMTVGALSRLPAACLACELPRHDGRCGDP